MIFERASPIKKIITAKISEGKASLILSAMPEISLLSRPVSLAVVLTALAIIPSIALVTSVCVSVEVSDADIKEVVIIF